DSGQAVIGAKVAALPRIRVLDARGNGVPGAAVTFVVQAGSGQVAGAASTTDGAGMATLESWRLGGTGTNRLTAKVSGASDSVVFTAIGSTGVYTVQTGSQVVGTVSLVAQLKDAS